jgi:hypothetical protein
MSNEIKNINDSDKKYILSSDIKISSGMPTKNDPIYSSWGTETITKLFPEKYIMMFIGMFIQNEESSIHLVDKTNGKTMALSGTRDYDEHFDDLLMFAQKIQQTPNENAIMKAMTNLHLFSLMQSIRKVSHYAKNVNKSFHNTGLLVAESYRKRKVLDEATGKLLTVGTYVYQEKLKYLTEKFGSFILCTNANNKGSQNIFEAAKMTCIQSSSYKEYHIPHEGHFKTYYIICAEIKPHVDSK